MTVRLHSLTVIFFVNGKFFAKINRKIICGLYYILCLSLTLPTRFAIIILKYKFYITRR